MEYNKHKSVTIPGQAMPLRELLHRFTNGVPISDNLERQGTYDFAKPFTPNAMPTSDMFNIGHDVNEIDITIAAEKARRSMTNGFEQPKRESSADPAQSINEPSGKQGE